MSVTLHSIIILDVINFQNIQKIKAFCVVISVETFRIKSKHKLQSIELLKTFFSFLFYLKTFFSINLICNRDQ